MTLILTVSCDGFWGEGAGLLACRGALNQPLPDGPLGQVIATLGVNARGKGWLLDDDGDLCPAHARARREWLATLPAPE